MGKTKQKGNAVMRKITELKEKQEIALGILLYLDKVCRKHHLIYFAADGTLLGCTWQAPSQSNILRPVIELI